MATTLGLNVQFTASASGMAKGLSQVDRQLKQLGSQAAAAASLFDGFASSSAAAAAAQQQTATDLAFLNSAFKTGQISAEQYAAELRGIVSAAQTSAAAFAEGARVTGQVATAEEKRATALTRLGELLKLGAIDQQTYDRAAAEASGANAAAAEAESQRAAALAEGARITAEQATEEEKRASRLTRLGELLEQGAISQQTYDRAAAEASGANAAAAEAESQRAAALARAAAITKANLTPQEQYDAEVQDLRDHLKQGAISQETFNRAVKSAQQQLQGAASAASTADSRLAQLAKSVRFISQLQIGQAIVNGLQSIASVMTETLSSLGNYVERIVGSVGATDDLSQRLGISTKALQSFQAAASLAGVQNLEGALQKLAVSIGDAANGSAAAQKAFANIGISVSQLQTLSPEEQFRAVSAALAAIPDPAARAAAAVDIFGRSGVELLPLFSGNLAKMEERLKKLGVVLSETQVSAIADMDDAFQLVSKTVQGIIGQIAGNIAPLVTDIANEFLGFVETFNAVGQGGTGIADAITEGLFDVVESLAVMFDDAVAKFNEFGFTMTSVSTGFDVVGRIFSAVTEALIVAFNVFEIAGNVLLLGLGKVLEGLGSWVNDGLEQFGKDLQLNAQLAAEKNAQDINEAGKRFRDAVTGAQDDERRRAGAAQSLVQDARNRFNDRNSPEAQAERARQAQERLFERLNGNFVTAAARAKTVFGEQVPAAVASAAAAVRSELLLAQANDGVIDEEEQKRIAAAQEKYNQAISEGADKLKEQEQREKRALDLEKQFAERQKDLTDERLAELRRASQQQLTIGDIRTSEGASQFLALATGREDPAVAEARKQLQELQKIQREIRELRNQPVEILGA